MLLLYKVKSKFGATVTKLISNYTLLLYKVKSKFGARVHPHMISHFVVGRFIKIGYYLLNNSKKALKIRGKIGFG